MRLGTFPDIALTYEWQRVRDIRERIRHLVIPFPQFGVTEQGVRAMFTPLMALERLDLSFHGIPDVKTLGLGWRIAECVHGERKEGAEYFMTVMRGIDGLKMPVVRVINFVRGEDFADVWYPSD